MTTFDFDYIREEYPGKSDVEAAKAYAEKGSYIAIVRYKDGTSSSGFSAYPCTWESDIPQFFNNPEYGDPELIFDGRAGLFHLNADHVLKGRCEKCGKRSTRETLQMGSGNDFYFCPKCGLLFCDDCYTRLPLTSSPGYGMCPKCKVKVKRAIPDFFITGSCGLEFPRKTIVILLDPTSTETDLEKYRAEMKDTADDMHVMGETSAAKVERAMQCYPENVEVRSRLLYCLDKSQFVNKNAPDSWFEQAKPQLLKNFNAAGLSREILPTFEFESLPRDENDTFCICEWESIHPNHLLKFIRVMDQTFRGGHSSIAIASSAHKKNWWQFWR